LTRLIAIALILCACTPSVPPDWPLPQWEIHGAPVVYEARAIPGSPVAVRLVGGLCVVEWDPEQWDDLSPAQRVLAVAHEVEHCRLAEAGYGDAERWALEYAADCGAIEWMITADYLPATWEMALVEWMLSWSSSPGHPAGADRAAAILECAARVRAHRREP